MNKKGQTLGLVIISAILIFIVGIMITGFLMDEITTARTNLDCSNAAGISDGTKLLCLAIDTTVPYWIWLVFSVTIGAVIARFVF